MNSQNCDIQDFLVQNDQVQLDQNCNFLDMKQEQAEFIYQSDCEDDVESPQLTPDFSSHLQISQSLQKNINTLPQFDNTYVQTIKENKDLQNFPSIKLKNEDSEFEMEEDYDTEEYRKDSRKSSKSKLSDMTVNCLHNESPHKLKKQSELKNANKYFMNQILNTLQDQVFDNQVISSTIQALKASGKKKQKSDVFNLGHYRAMFLNLDAQNINQLKDNDRKLHSQIFGIRWNQQIPAEQIHRINQVKRDLFQITMEYLTELKLTKNKMLQLKEDYQEWINRIVSGVSKMREGKNVLKF